MKFLWEDIFCRHRTPWKVVMDGGPENKREVKALLAKLGVKKVTVSAYHPQANGMIERGHRGRDPSVGIGGGGRGSESRRPSPSTQLAPPMYPANPQHTAVPGPRTVPQITWAENFSDSKPETINA